MYEEISDVCIQIERENWLSKSQANPEPFQTNNGINLLTQTWQTKPNDSTIQKNDILDWGSCCGFFFLYKTEGLVKNFNST